MDSIFHFHHPTSIVVAGPTRSGKTVFVIKCLKHSLIQPFPNRIIFLYKEWQPAYDDLKTMIPTIEFHEGLDNATLSSVTSADKNLVIIDDLMSTAGDSKLISKLFTQESHHKNLTVVFLVQNLFYHGKEMRNISLNAHYLVMYKNPRDKSQIRYLAQQTFPENTKFLANAFHHATTQPHTYLILDLHPDTSEDFRILTNIFPEEIIRFYLPSTV
ncbi:MAG: hypothetical protein FD143_3441 [Ignavibacteria bacterium]|nr:MAG: hypothetical protein FD143_3441 [Ignavibacteria bacterium]